MKKLLLFLSLIIVVVGATAQDTIYSVYPPENYFVYGYPSALEITSGCQIGVFLGSDYMGFYRYSKEPITVYGIAGSLDLPYRLRQGRNWQMVVDRVIDTTRDSSYEYMCMFRADTLPIFVGDSLKINCWTSDVTYYIDFGFGEDPYPVYERYFTAPVQICDSFYIGITNRTHIDYICNYWPINLQGIGGFWISGAMDSNVCHFSPEGGNPYWRYYEGPGGMYPFIFPILTPPDNDTMFVGNDTTTVASDTIAAGDTLIVCDTVIVCDTLIVGYDTIINYDTIITYDTLLALPERGLLGRLVGVMPNPAGSTAKVVSSFGLTMVEAFTMAGERLCTLRMPDAPLTATLDVSRWPSGAYLLRIHTPQGVAVKKLMVRR